MPEPEFIAEKGSVALCAYPAGSFRPKDKVLRLCRWKAGANRLFLSDFIPMEEFDSVQEAINQAALKLTQEKQTSSKRR